VLDSSPDQIEKDVVLLSASKDALSEAFLFFPSALKLDPAAADPEGSLS
jgi:hypothetical protein